MTDEQPTPLEGVDIGSGTLDDDERERVREALASETNIRRNEAAQTLSLLADEDVDEVRPFVDDLLALLDDERNAIAQQAATALLGVAREYPEDFVDVVPTVVGVLERDFNSLELLGTQILVQVVLEEPGTVAPQLDRICAVLDGRSPAYEASGGFELAGDEEAQQTMIEHDKEENKLLVQSQARLSNVVVAAAEGDPEAAADHVDSFLDLFDSPDTTVVGAAVDAIAEVAQADPEAAAEAYDGLIACLNHKHDSVRVRAVRALGHLGDDRAVGPLEDLARAEDDEEVAELAEETAAFLADD